MDATLLYRHLGAATCCGCRRAVGYLCDGCRERSPVVRFEGRVPYVDRVLPAWAYEDAARSLVLGLKVRGRRGAADVLADAIAASIRRHGLRARALTWVPGRPADRRNRGFDHAELLARRVARLIGVPAVPILARVRDPADQTSLGAAARWDNLRGVFRAESSPERIAIVDDLVTTGATLSACGAALKAAGARSVEGAVACIAP